MILWLDVYIWRVSWKGLVLHFRLSWSIVKEMPHQPTDLQGSVVSVWVFKTRRWQNTFYHLLSKAAKSWFTILSEGSRLNTEVGRYLYYVYWIWSLFADCCSGHAKQTKLSWTRHSSNHISLRCHREYPTVPSSSPTSNLVVDFYSIDVFV